MEIFAHRARGFGFKENSVKALEECLKEGFFYEIDLRELRDGTVIINHDPVAKGQEISQKTRPDIIQTYLTSQDDAPLFLDDVVSLMEKYPKSQGLWELKISSPSFLDEVGRAIAAAHLNERVTVIGFPAHAKGLNALAKKGITAGLIDTWPLAMVSHAKRYGVSVILSGGTNALTRAFFFSLIPLLRLKKQIKTLHARDEKFIAGVINSAGQTRELFRLGCDGLVTDKPREIRRYFEE